MPILCTFSYHEQTIEITTFDTPKTKPAKVRKTPLRKPGSGDISIDPVELSSRQIAPEDDFSFSSRIHGTNIAHIYAEIMLQDDKQGILYGPVWRSFISAPTENENQGVVYPEWEENIEVTFQHQAVLHLLNDGSKTAFAFLNLERYSINDEFSLAGIYVKSEQGKHYEARLDFDDKGNYSKVMVKRPGKRVSTPRPTHPQPGDQFTPYVQLLSPSKGGSGAWLEEKGLSNSLTFGEKPLTLEQAPAFAGNYAVGYAVKDLDGEVWRRYETITIRA